jgi:hypothetical protein
MTFKKIDPTFNIFHHFELKPGLFALYDDELDMPVAYGSKDLVWIAMNRIKAYPNFETVLVIYYKRDNRNKSSYTLKGWAQGGKFKNSPFPPTVASRRQLS